MTSYAVSVQNTLKFSLAPSALAISTLKFCLKHRKNAKIFVGAFGAPKDRPFLSVPEVLPPSGKFTAGAHAYHMKLLTDAVQELLKKGADIHAINNKGLTAMHVAAQYGCKEILLHLMKQPGANVDVSAVRDLNLRHTNFLDG